MSNIVISGYYGSKNAGDEAMLSAMLEVLLDLDEKLNITVISSDPEYTHQRHGVNSIYWLDVWAILKALKNADLLISGGGSLLQNVTSGRSLYYYMGILFLAKLVNTPIMLYAQGIGPIYGKVPRLLMRWFGNHSGLITVRDKDSLMELATLKITKPPIKATADPVLAINKVSTEVGEKILTEVGMDLQRPILGISVREWRNWNHYKEVIAEVADTLIREGNYQILFMPMQFPEDVKVAKQISTLMKCPATVLNKDYTTAELLSIVGNMDLMIGVRLHALIFAGVMEVPMIGISYDPKIDRFLKTLDIFPVGSLQSITVDSLLEEIKSSLNAKQKIVDENNKLMKNLRVLARHNGELAIQFIKNHTR